MHTYIYIYADLNFGYLKNIYLKTRAEAIKLNFELR